MAGFLHASREVYVPGTALDIVEQTFFYTMRLRDPTFARMENILEQFRPMQAASRRTSRFACESIADCGAYINAERRSNDVRPIRYYRVQMPKSTRVPMSLSDHLYRHLDSGEEKVIEIAREYWNPTRPWKFWERLGGMMVIEAEIEPPGLVEIGLGISRAMDDKSLRDQLWP